MRRIFRKVKLLWSGLNITFSSIRWLTDYQIELIPFHHLHRFYQLIVLFLNCGHDENIVVSGGWDNTIQFWDIRVGYAVRSIFGPHICGDSLDVVGNRIVTGSWRPNNQLEMWDYLSGQKLADIPWHVLPNQPPCMLYAAQFSKEGQGRFVAAGGSGANEAKVFDTHSNNSIVGTVTGMARGVFSVDFSPETQTQKLAIAGGDASIRVFDIVNRF